MSKDKKILIKHILQSIDLIFTYIRGKNKAQFQESVGLQDKVIRRLAIVGEAVKNLPKDFKARYRDLPWKEAAGMRDILVHEYYDVDINTVWNVAKKRLPAMKKRLMEIMEND